MIMDQQMPSFADSEWVIFEPGNWHLKPGAPKNIQEEFIEFMAALAEEGDTGKEEIITIDIE